MRTNAIARLIVLIILLGNQIMVMFGMEPLPYSDEEIYKAVSSVLAFGFSIYTWWKHNNITSEAEETQKILKQKKRYKKETKIQQKELDNHGKH